MIECPAAELEDKDIKETGTCGSILIDVTFLYSLIKQSFVMYTIQFFNC